MVIPVEQLRVGMHIHLDMKWFEHPFAFSHFKIKSEDQIATILSLNLKTVLYTPELSDGPQASGVAETPVAAPIKDRLAGHLAVDQPSSVMQAKRKMMEQMRERRLSAERIEGAFIQTATAIREIEKNLFSNPVATVEQAHQLVKKVVDSILVEPELAIHVMGDRLGGEDLYFHSLNVTMLALMIARDIKLPNEVVATLGLGALMHDIGKKEIPDKVLLKQGALTQAERNFYEMHCEYGVAIGKRLQFTPAVLAIIGQHHELADGSGYPAGLKGDAIQLLARIVVIANYYDDLCNPNAIADALTPHEALSLMFAKLRSKFDAKILPVLVRCLGVYPPGTIVQLSNGAIGMVSTVDTSSPMKPTVVVYDADIPKDEAILLNMAMQQEVNIAKALRPAQLPSAVYNYLSPRKRVSYYFGSASPRTEASKA
jgi:putative nucleotidyltransferase with HDIG domain